MVWWWRGGMVVERWYGGEVVWWWRGGMVVERWYGGGEFSDDAGSQYEMI